MLNLAQIESDLSVALKARDSLTADTLRGLKTRIQNEKIAKQKELSEDDILALVRNEIKKRRESAQVYEKGGRAELASKELSEAQILQKYLPPEIPESEIAVKADAVIAENSFAQKDFGQAMGKLKALLPSVDGAVLAKILKEKLK